MSGDCEREPINNKYRFRLPFVQLPSATYLNGIRDQESSAKPSEIPPETQQSTAETNSTAITFNSLCGHHVPGECQF